MRGPTLCLPRRTALQGYIQQLILVCPLGGGLVDGSSRLRQLEHQLLVLVVPLALLLLLVVVVHGVSVVEKVQLLQLLDAVVVGGLAGDHCWRHLVMQALAAADELPGVRQGRRLDVVAARRRRVVGQDGRGGGHTRGLLAGERGLRVQLLHGH